MGLAQLVAGIDFDYVIRLAVGVIASRTLFQCFVIISCCSCNYENRTLVYHQATESSSWDRFTRHQQLNAILHALLSSNKLHVLSAYNIIYDSRRTWLPILRTITKSSELYIVANFTVLAKQAVIKMAEAYTFP